LEGLAVTVHDTAGPEITAVRVETGAGDTVVQLP